LSDRPGNVPESISEEIIMMASVLNALNVMANRWVTFGIVDETITHHPNLRGSWIMLDENTKGS
jgi:predicted small secreted protein